MWTVKLDLKKIVSIIFSLFDSFKNL